MKRSALSRRNFIKTSVLGTSGAAFATRAFGNTLDTSEDSPVITRKLGKTGLELPIVSMGVMRSDNPNLVKAALKSGIVHLDTAQVYQGGNNEKMLGELLKNYPRDSFIISTKIKPEDSFIDRSRSELTSESSKEAFLKRLDDSLTSLQMDYVDILYVHALESRQAVLHEQLLEALTEAKKSGKVRFVGVSTHRNEPEVIQAVIDSNVYDVVLTAINFKQSNYAELKEKIALASEKGIGIVGMKTMAGAFLDRERTQPINCKAALKWVLQDPNVHTTIPGITSFDMLLENISVMHDLKLTEEELNDLQTAGLQAGLYCDGCSDCLGSCKKGLPVHDIMRAYMYTYGYQSTIKARDLLADYNLKNNPCADCNTCTVNCPKGFEIAERIKDVTRLQDIPREFLT
ncbi:MAG: aldo/keto reductase [Bacteroidales bacterium]|nr:aldo/keto reductase [Bacteroidales bacterium]